MRATGLNFKSPKERTGEFVIPTTTNYGKNTDYSKKPLIDQKRELLYLHKLNTDEQFKQKEEVFNKERSNMVDPTIYNTQ